MYRRKEFDMLVLHSFEFVYLLCGPYRSMGHDLLHIGLDQYDKYALRVDAHEIASGQHLAGYSLNRTYLESTLATNPAQTPGCRHSASSLLHRLAFTGSKLGEIVR
jgi:hypothetical protein